VRGKEGVEGESEAKSRLVRLPWKVRFGDFLLCCSGSGSWFMLCITGGGPGLGESYVCISEWQGTNGVGCP
jgi:hypothetical protein